MGLLDLVSTQGAWGREQTRARAGIIQSTYVGGIQDKILLPRRVALDFGHVPAIGTGILQSSGSSLVLGSGRGLASHALATADIGMLVHGACSFSGEGAGGLKSGGMEHEDAGDISDFNYGSPSRQIYRQRLIPQAAEGIRCSAQYHV